MTKIHACRCGEFPTERDWAMADIASEKIQQSKTEDMISSRGENITAAAQVLIGVVRRSELMESGRAIHAEMDLEIGLTGGGRETWKITIERTASAH